MKSGRLTLDERRSMLDAVLDHRGAATVVHNRLIYVARVQPGYEISALEGYHKRLFRENMVLSADWVYTGILMHFSNDTMLHMLEGSAEFIDGFLSSLSGDQNSPVAAVKILLSTEDIGQVRFSSTLAIYIPLPYAFLSQLYLSLCMCLCPTLCLSSSLSLCLSLSFSVSCCSSRTLDRRTSQTGLSRRSTYRG